MWVKEGCDQNILRKSVPGQWGLFVLLWLAYAVQYSFIQCALSSLGFTFTFQKSTLYAGKHGLLFAHNMQISELLIKYSSNWGI